MRVRYTGRDAARRASSLPSFSSGSRAIDTLLEGGFRAGRLAVAFGKSNSGKSQLAMQTALCAAKAGADTLYIDTEGAFRPERVDEMARARGWRDPSLLKRIVYLRCSSAAEQAETVRRMDDRKETSRCKLVIVDTLTKNFSLDLPGTENLAERQGALDVFLSEAAREAFVNGRAYLMTNRVTFDARGSDVCIGGSTVAQLVHTSLHLEREGRMVRVSEPGGAGSVVVEIGPLGIGAG